MRFLSRFFRSAPGLFNNAGDTTQRRVSVLVGLAEFLRHTVSNDGLKILLSEIDGVAGIRVGPEQRAELERELVLALAACVRIPETAEMLRWWGLEVAALRELMVIVLLAQYGDDRQTLTALVYAADSDEALAQFIVAVDRTVNGSDGSIIRRLRQGEFLQKWRDYQGGFVSGALAGMNRSDYAAVSSDIAQRLQGMSPRSKSIVLEFLERCEEGRIMPPWVRYFSIVDLESKRCVAELGSSLGVVAVEYNDRSKGSFQEQVADLNERAAYGLQLALFVLKVLPSWAQFLETDSYQRLSIEVAGKMAAATERMLRPFSHGPLAIKTDRQKSLNNARKDVVRVCSIAHRLHQQRGTGGSVDPGDLISWFKREAGISDHAVVSRLVVRSVENWLGA